MANISNSKLIFKGALLLLLSSLAYSGNAQIITSIGGSGVAGYNGDGAATETQLYAPQGVAVSGGTVYIADGMNNRLRKVTAQGTIITIAGNDDPGNRGDDGPATDAQLNGPIGVATDKQGNLYVADKYNNRIRKITRSGVISAFAGNGEKGYSGNDGLAVNAELNAPTAVVADSAGNVYIADAGNNCIRKVTPGGIISTIAGNGTAGFAGDGGNATLAQLNSPFGVALDSVGNLYIADSWNYRIRRVNRAGNIRTIAGTGAAGYDGDGKIDTAAILNLPTGIVIDKAGNIYFTDQGNNRIRRITTTGIISTVAGNGNAGFSGDGGNAMAAELNAPYGMAIDGGGNLYIAEQQNNRIRRVTPPPAPSIAKTTTKAPATKSTNLPPIASPPPVRGGTPINRGFQYSPGSVPKASGRGNKG